MRTPSAKRTHTFRTGGADAGGVETPASAITGKS
jgi:hypothetical protein